MKLSELHVRCLLAAAKSKIMLKRSWLLDAFTVTNTKDTDVVYKGTPLKIGNVAVVDKMVVGEHAFELGQVVSLNSNLVGIVESDDASSWKIAVLSDLNHPIFHRLDTLDLDPTMVRSYLDNNTMVQTAVKNTTVGRLLENVIVLQIPTEFKFYGFLNEVWNPDKIIQRVTDDMTNKKISVPVYKKIIDHFFYLNHITEIAVPSMTEKSLMTSPRVAELKAKFIASHTPEQLKDPIVLKELEDILRKEDAEYLGKGTDHEDPSVTFFDGLGKKSWELHRKKLFLTVGGIPAFDESSGKFDFVQNSLSEGWTIDALPSIANEIRKGSYERGRETAKGGAETKLVMRVFQDLTIDNEDCGTKRTLKVDFKSLCRVKDFIGRVVRLPGGQDVEITPENMKQFDGKMVDVYSPLFCATPYNLCYKCCGRRSRDLNAKMIGIQVVKITSKFMNTAMKNMHGTVLKIIQPSLESIFV